MPRPSRQERPIHPPNGPVGERHGAQTARTPFWYPRNAYTPRRAVLHARAIIDDLRDRISEGMEGDAVAPEEIEAALASFDRLVAGARRLKAAKALGWATVPVYVVHNVEEKVDRLEAERDENTCREPLAPSENTRLGMSIEKEKAKEAKERQTEAGKRHGRGKNSLSSTELKLSGKRHPQARDLAA